MLQILQDGNEGFCIFGPGGPARGKADYCMVFVVNCQAKCNTFEK